MDGERGLRVLGKGFEKMAATSSRKGPDWGIL